MLQQPEPRKLGVVRVILGAGGCEWKSNGKMAAAVAVQLPGAVSKLHCTGRGEDVGVRHAGPTVF